MIARSLAPATTRRLAALVGLAAVVALVAGGCSMDDLQRAGAAGGDVELQARFDDAVDLTPGHDVEIADVRVGSVTDIRLDGHQAVVTMSIEDGIEVPEGTEAVIAQSSLLGGNYLELRVPPEAEGGRLLGDGDTIEDTSVDPVFEQVTEKVTELLAAIGANDLASIVETGAGAFGGRGEELGTFITDLASLTDHLEGSSEEIVTAIDRFAALTHGLAAGTDELTTLTDDLSAATGVLAANRTELVAMLEALVATARATNEIVLTPHLARIDAALGQLAPILGTLADHRDQLDQLLVDVNGLVRAAEAIIAEGEIRYYGWLSGFTLGDQIIRAPGDVNSGMGQLIPLAGLDELVNGGTG